MDSFTPIPPVKSANGYEGLSDLPLIGLTSAGTHVHPSTFICITLQMHALPHASIASWLSG